MFMLVTLNPDAAMLSFDILSFDILSLDILSSDIALSTGIIPVTLTWWPTCGLRSSELISSTPSFFHTNGLMLPNHSRVDYRGGKKFQQRTRDLKPARFR
jgi:hypothetical protein